jgi:hypothetical protein
MPSPDSFPIVVQMMPSGKACYDFIGTESLRQNGFPDAAHALQAGERHMPAATIRDQSIAQRRQFQSTNFRLS